MNESQILPFVYFIMSLLIVYDDNNKKGIKILDRKILFTRLAHE
jgi:hypothetical protein